jgi:hypothetical protein
MKLCECGMYEDEYRSFVLIKKKSVTLFEQFFPIS